MPLFADSPGRGPQEPGAADDAPPGPLSVTTLVARIKGALNDAFPTRVAVSAEISNFKRHTSGHLYFRLKDANCAVDAVMFRSDASGLKFSPEDGMEVLVEGRVDVYEVRGQLQLYVERMSPRGAGALEQAFRRLCEKLKSEGLFDAVAKKPIVRFPRAVGIITSASGAAVRDIARTLRGRWGGVRAYLVPALVQGEGAAESIVTALKLLDANAPRLEIDTIILSRGGGSLEDLWSFNDESVARAIFAARTPIISGVGHEMDITVSDLVADARAATPTAAAQMAVPDARETGNYLASLLGRMERSLGERLASARADLQAVMRSAVFRDPRYRLRTRMQRLDELSHRLRSAAERRVSASRRRLESPACRLASVHPSRLLERAGGRLSKAANRLAWSLGARSNRAGNELSAVVARLAAARPQNRLVVAGQRVSAAEKQLDALSYRNVIRRGFSVTRAADGRIIRTVEQTNRGDTIETELCDGKIYSRVTESDEATRKERT